MRTIKLVEEPVVKKYETLLDEFCVYPKDREVEYLVLGLTSEVGEVCDKLKKSIRDNKELNKDAICLELGDVLFYLVQLNKALNSDFVSLMVNNVSKLQSRKDRGVLKGSGDDR